MRFLLLAYESECFSLCRLAQRLQDEGHEVQLVLCDYYNFIDSDRFHRFFNEHGFESWVNFESQYRRLYAEEPNVEWEYLRKFEANLCVDKNLQQLLMSDPVLARHHHHRDPYYTPIDSEERRFFWAELQIRWLRTVLKEFDPDVLFTIKRTYFIKNVAAQFSKATGIPMLTLIRSRLGQRCHVVDNFGYGTEDRAMEYLTSSGNHPDLQKARSEIEEFASDDDASLYEASSQAKIADGDLYSTGDVVRFLGERAVKVGSKIALRKKRKYRWGFHRGNYFNSHWPNVIYHYTRIAYNRLKYVHFNPFERRIPDGDFVYYPLHTLPESSTLTLSTEYFEGDLVRHLAKECPAGIEIALKENPNMVGMRPFDFYDDMKSIPNVRLLDPTVPSKRLIRESKGVCGISGTALLEAAMLDTPTLTFGHPEFEAVATYRGHSQVPTFFDHVDAGRDDTSDDILRYVQYLFDVGEELPLRTMRTDPTSEEFEPAVDTMHELLRREVDARGYSW